MTRVLRATCDASGVVTCEGVTVPAARVLTAGKAASSGILILDEDRADYVATNTTDIEALIESVVEIVNKVVEITTSLDAVTLSPGAAAANIALLTTMATQLNLTKDLLK